MGTRPQFALLMLTALVGVMNPPSRSPGFRPPKSARMIRCNHKDCQGMGAWQAKFRYDCDVHDHSFYYCYVHKDYLSQEQAVEYQDETT
jgi:hypothetical protein